MSKFQVKVYGKIILLTQPSEFTMLKCAAEIATPVVRDTLVDDGVYLVKLDISVEETEYLEVIVHCKIRRDTDSSQELQFLPLYERSSNPDKASGYFSEMGIEKKFVFSSRLLDSFQPSTQSSFSVASFYQFSPDTEKLLRRRMSPEEIVGQMREQDQATMCALGRWMTIKKKVFDERIITTILRYLSIADETGRVSHRRGGKRSYRKKSYKKKNKTHRKKRVKSV